MKKQVLSLLLALVLIFSMIPITSIATFAAVTTPTGVWTDYASTSFAGGDGSETSPYQIATANDLALLAVKANSGIGDNGVDGKYFILTDNIDLSAHRWVPICTGNDEGSRSFTKAHFNGNEKTITGLYVEESDGSYAGFFGDLQIATIKNLTIKDAVIKATGKVGILAGDVSYSYDLDAPKIENCHVSGTVEGVGYVGGMIGYADFASIKNCTSNCNVTGQWTVGGFIGCIFAGNIEKCESATTISCSNWNNGGFIGYNDGSTIKNSIARGTLDNTMTGNIYPPKSGGFVGTNATDAVISNCHTTVKVTVVSKIGNPGGFIGYAGPGDPDAGYVDYGTTQNCSFNAENYDNVTAIGYVDGDNSGENDITGADANTVLTNICKDYYGNTNHKYGSDNTCTDCGYTIAYWTDDGNYDISWYVGHESDYSYEIADAADLAGLSVLVNGLNGQTAVDFSYSITGIPAKFLKTITLKKDIDLSGKLWTPIGTNAKPFKGTLNGNSKTITNMTVVANASFAGLFGCVGDSSTSSGLQIYNLKVTSSSVTATGDSANYIAGIVGYMVNGTLRDCSYNGIVSAEGQFVGGVIGQPHNTNVTNCVNYATVTATGTQATKVGGVVGDSMGYIKNCANFGSVSGYYDVGGIAGKVSSGSLKTCYNVGNITATNTSTIAGAIVGYVNPPYYGVTSIDNCYFLDDTATEALGSAQAQFKTTMYSASKTDFTSGKVAYLLNGKDGGTNFYQNLDNDKTVDEYPFPDSTHGTVYHYTVYTKCDKSDTNPVVKYGNTSKSDVVPAHIYKYSASDNVITETCNNCNSHTETATIVISSTDDFIYSGNAYTPATVDYSDGWQGGELECSYKNNTNAGTNSATVYIKVGDEEATLAFSIKKADNEWTTIPTISDWTYGESANTPNYKSKFGTVKVAYSGTVNDGTSYSSDKAPAEAGSYKATFTVEGTNNYTKLETSVDFVINKADQSAPSGLVGTPEDIDERENGTITGVTSAMEYRKNDETGYTAITDTELTNLADGTYYIRYKADSNHNASLETKVVLSNDKKLQVTVPATQVGYTLTASNSALKWNESTTLTFALKEGYSKLDNFAVKVNGELITLDNDGKYTKVNVTENLTVTVEGVADITAPTAEIALGKNKWNEFFNTITFGLFFKDTQTVTITATDMGSGVDKIYYYLSTTELTEEQVKVLPDSDWTEYTGAFSLNPQDEYIIYAKAVDKDNNAKYISSDKTIVIDNIAPVISGIADGETHYGDTTFTVTDKHIDEVKVDGNPVTLTADGKYTIKADGKEHAIIATDKSGNASAEIKITVITISSLDDTIDGITTDNVKSSDKKAIEDVQSFVNGLIAGGKDFTDAEDTELANIKANTEALLNKITTVSAEMSNLDSSVKAYDINKVKSDDKAAINGLITRIDVLLNGNNLTENEKAEMTALKTTAQGLVKRNDDTAKKVTDLTEDVNAYDNDKVTSEDKQDITDLVADIDKLLDGDNLNDSEKDELKKVKDTATALIEKIEEAAGSTETDNTDKVKDITSDNVETKDKSDLEKAKDDLEKALEDYKDNLTDDEKKDIQDEINRIEKALEVIGKVEKVEDLINKLPANIAKSDADAIKKADEAYNALSKYEQSILDKNAKKKLDNAKSALEALNKATNSPATGDTGNIWMWFALLFVSGSGVLGTTAYRRKRKETKN